MKRVLFTFLIFAMGFGLLPLFGADRSPININLIIDGSDSLTAVKADVTAWISGRLDQLLADGDIVTIWSAGSQTRVIYSGTMTAPADREAAKKSIRDLTGAGTAADFSGALGQAANLQNRPAGGSGFSYTLLVCASSAALSNLISGPQSGMMRFSRVEEFSGWKAIVVGLNIDARVKRAAAAFFR